MSAWKPTTAFCWQPKEALRLIEANTDQPASAILVYVALTRIASDEQSASFTKPIGYIAKLACVERRTVERRLSDLERLQLVAIRRGELGTAHTYTLATISRNPLRNKVAGGATQNGPVPVALIEEYKEGTSLSFQEMKRRIAFDE